MYYTEVGWNEAHDVLSGEDESRAFIVFSYYVEDGHQNVSPEILQVEGA